MPELSLELVAEGLEQPFLVVGDPVEQEVLYILEKDGYIKRLGPGETGPPEENWFEIEVSSARHETGLVGLAFHPHFADNGLFYVSYNTHHFRWMVTEFKAVDGAVDYNSARNVFGSAQPYDNHNGGMIQFGPDEMLYIAVGDGGQKFDECQNGQDGSTHLGTVLRIDVEPDGIPDNGTPCGAQTSAADPNETIACRCPDLPSFDFTVPSDNPFIKDPDIRDEIYAYGFRNPWRFAFDRVDGRLFLGDIGRDTWEEVSVVEAGGNYGWSLMEGNHCYAPKGEAIDESLCDESADPGQANEHGFIAPVAEYRHQNGRGAVVGLGSYRSCEVPAFGGRFFFADRNSAEIWSVTYDGTTATMSEPIGLLPNGFRPIAGGYNALGDVFLISYPFDATPGSASVYRLTGAQSSG